MAHPVTIDLRKDKARHKPEGEPARESKNVALLSWSAAEATSYKRSREWYAGVAIIAAGLVAFAVILRNYFFAIFIALAIIVLFSWTRQKPRHFRFTITEKGISAGNREFLFANLTSFWIFEDTPRPYIALKPRGKLTPMIHMPLGEVKASEVRLLLRPHLEETEEQESLADVIARWLKI